MWTRVWPWLLFGGLAITFAALGVAVVGLNFWAALGIAVFAIVANGLLATLEDDVPGGFNNPEGKHTPKYVKAVAWSVRAVGFVGVILIAVLIGLAVFG